MVEGLVIGVWISSTSIAVLVLFCSYISLEKRVSKMEKDHV
jgi:hypothetical protein